MLLCRSLLRQVHISRLAHFTSRWITVTHELAQLNSNFVDAPICATQTTDIPTPPKTVSTTIPLPEPVPRLAVSKLLRILRQKPKMPSSFQPGSTGSAENLENNSAVDQRPLLAYRLLRENDRKSIAKISVHSYLRLAEHAFRARSHSTLQHIAIDIIEMFRGNEAKLMQLVEAFLALSVRFESLSNKRTLFLLSELQDSGLIQSLSPAIIVRLAHALTHYPPHKPLLIALTPLIAKCLDSTPRSPHTKSVSLWPPATFRVGCVFAWKLLNADLQQEALSVFRALLNTMCVPFEAIPVVDSSLPQDPTFLIRSVIIRSCIFWDLRLQLERLLADVVECISQPDKPLFDLTIDGLNALLEPPCTPSNVSFSAGIIRRLHSWAAFPIPDSLLCWFYESAIRIDRGEDAESVFAHTRQSAVVEKYQYPIPKGEALMPFLRYLTLNSRNVHLARVLVTEVVRTKEAIPLQDRAEFIALAASNGYASQARALWERYAGDGDGKIVVGNAAILVRMVSLFANLIKTANTKLQEANTMTAAMELRSASPHGERLDVAATQQKLEDLNQFAQRLISEFLLALPSLSHASHWELTSLARAYFLLGKVTDGFNTLKILLDRNEVPDLHDVNVALSVIARHDPASATRIIQRMINLRLVPDTVTFGTVLHQAIIRGDEAQIEALMDEASKFGASLTHKTIGSLIQNYLTAPESDTQTSSTERVQRAMQIIESMVAKTPDLVCTPNTGEACILASLRADDPMMAFRFWKLLVMDKTEWEDGKQRLLRRKISSGIRRHWEDGRICQAEGRRALSRLGRKER